MAQDAVLDATAWDRLAVHAKTTAEAIMAPQASDRPPGYLARLTHDVLARHRAAWRTLLHPLDTFRAWLVRVLAPPASGSPTAVQGSVHGAQAAGRDPQTVVTAPAISATNTPTLEATWQSVRDELFAAAQDPTADPKTVGARIATTIPAEHRAAMAERLTALAQTAQVTAQALQAKAQAQAQNPEPSPSRAETPSEQTTAKASEPAEPQRRGPKAPVPETSPVPVTSSVPSRSTKRAAHR